MSGANADNTRRSKVNEWPGGAIAPIILLVIVGFAFVIPWIDDYIIGGYSSPCSDILRQIEAVKEHAALEEDWDDKVDCDLPENRSFINQFMKGGEPSCPDGGTYVYGLVGEYVTCSLGSIETNSSHRPFEPEEKQVLDDVSASPYQGFVADIAALRDTTLVSTNIPKTFGSSDNACKSAQRIFQNIDFVGKTEAEVLEMLGDPETISSFGIAAGDKDRSTLVYRFDTGWGGSEYTLLFDNGVVSSLRVGGIN